MSKKTLEGLAILTNREIDPDLALRIEQEAFTNELPETREGIKFLLERGNVLALKDTKTGEYRGITELINLSELLDSNVPKEVIRRLPPDSPLGIILKHDRSDYKLRVIIYDYPGRTAYHYAHGIAVNPKGLGYGPLLFRNMIKKFVGKQDLMFGFVMASPLDIPSIRMYLRQGAIIDSFVNNIYEPGRVYFRMVYDKKIRLNAKVQREIPLKENYIDEVSASLAEGFVGTTFKQPNTLVFNRRL